MKEHVRTDCNKLKRCDHCHAIGYVKQDYFLLIVYPENFKGDKKVNAVIRGTLVPGRANTTVTMGEQGTMIKLHKRN